MLHNWFDVWWYVFKLGMIDSVLSSIWGERKVSYRIFINLIIKVEKDAEARVCKDGMCRFRKNVIVWKTVFDSNESIQCQAFLNGGMRELYDLMAFPVDNDNETWIHKHNHFFCVCWTLICVKCRKFLLVEQNCKNLHKLFNMKRTNKHHETLEKSLSIFVFLFINSQQSAAVSFIQCLLQVVQNLLNTHRNF